MDIDIKLPESWGQLTQSQLKTVLKYLSSSTITIHQCKILLAMKLGGISFHSIDQQGALVKFNGVFIILSDDDMLALAHSLDFIEEDPGYPVRLFELKHRKAVHPDMRDLNFAQWLAIENLYFGFLETRDLSLLNEILTILYPKSGLFSRLVKTFNKRSLDYTHINALKWISSFKKWLCRRYPELFKTLETSGDYSMSSNQRKLMESMNAQIRALTKGDITKKETVLNMDLHSALTELDALALEARKLNEASRKINKK